MQLYISIITCKKNDVGVPAELFCRVHGGEYHALHTGILSGFYPFWCVFKYNTVFVRHFELICTLKIGFRVGFAGAYIFGPDYGGKIMAKPKPIQYKIDIIMNSCRADS